MARLPTNNRPSNGRFAKGVSGNPSGRPRGSGSHETELRRLEEAGLALAANTADIIAGTAKLALTKIGSPELIPLFDAITDAAKSAVKDGEIGPSSVALLRAGFDDLQVSGQHGEFFNHAGLPADCDWEAFKAYYTTRKRIDHDRHVEDLRRFPPIAQRIKELKAQMPVKSCNRQTQNKLKIGFD